MTREWREGPLAGLRVLDLSSVVFGPVASQVLADYGAEVVKVEPPGGDSTRHTGPAVEPGMAALFLGCNRGKKSVLLDLKQPAAQAALHALLGTVDVFMHSMRPQKLAALGLDPATLRERHPRLVYAGLHGFGEDGPYAGRPAYDDVIQGMSGLVDLVQRQTGEARFLPTLAADKTCGLVAAHAILAALLRRERTGEGSFVEIPMYETMVGFNLVEHFYGLHFYNSHFDGVHCQGIDPEHSERLHVQSQDPDGLHAQGPASARPPAEDPHAASRASGAGYPRVLARSRKPYRTLDGHVCLMPYTDAHWRRFFGAVGEPQWADDTRFSTQASRTRHIDALLDLLSRHVATQTTGHWLATCERLEIPAAPVVRLDDLPGDPHLAATGFFASVHDPAMGELRFPRPGVRIDGAQAPIVMPPRLGEHTAELLREAGLGDAAIAALDPRAPG